jgi:hypothetical protein
VALIGLASIALTLATLAPALNGVAASKAGRETFIALGLTLKLRCGTSPGKP